MKDISQVNITNSKSSIVNAVDKLIELTNFEIYDDTKRTYNYLKWISTKTTMFIGEKNYTCPKLNDIRRGSVVWVEFGCNIGKEFGGRHPAIILRRTGESIFVVPLSSQSPEEIKDYHVKIEKVYGFTNMIRWANVLRIKDVSIQRIDFTSSIGNVKGHVLDSINAAIKISHIY